MKIEYRDMPSLTTFEKFMDEQKLTLVIYNRTFEDGSKSVTGELETKEGFEVMFTELTSGALVVYGDTETKIVNRMADKISGHRLFAPSFDCLAPDFPDFEWGL